MTSTPGGCRLWEDWLHGSLGHLRDAQLLRTLRPTVWCNSSSKALIHRADLDAWAAGQAPVVRHYDDCALIAGSAAVVPTHSHSQLSTSSNARAAACVVRQYGDPDLTLPAVAAAAAEQPTAATTAGGAGCGCLAGGCSTSGRCPDCRQGSRLASGGAGCSSCSSGSGSSCSGNSSGSSSSDPGDMVRLRLFSLNDYLGLASHPEVAQAAARVALRAGMGPRSSALVAGYTHSHRQLEEGLAALKGTQDCLLFPTGFAANLAIMTSLSYAAPAAVATAGASGSGSSSSGSSSSSGLAIYSDELNHASIIDGARLASRGGGGDNGAVQLHVYRHNDLAHLEELLAATPAGVRRLVVTDSLFSMDGDFADLRGLVALRRRQPFLLAVDEAHATLVCGEGGGGAAEALGVGHEVDLHVGTLSKAFGALGGFVACSSHFKSLLLNRGRALVYSTSLPLPTVEAAAAALRVSQRESWRRAHVWSLVRRLGEGLGVPALSPVVPLVVGPEGPTLDLSSRLLRAGLHVPAIRPPTVPAGTCRLRVSLSAAHSYDDVDELIGLVRQSGVPLVRLPHLLDPRAALPPPPPPVAFGPEATMMPYSRL
ncbi:hypothetical protein PLESTM_001796000 [Pleodorina starrii]|nr:hypothetical protein PLESTM_001796000 [Pleodorina starrii]